MGNGGIGIGIGVGIGGFASSVMHAAHEAYAQCHEAPYRNVDRI